MTEELYYSFKSGMGLRYPGRFTHIVYGNPGQ